MTKKNLLFPSFFLHGHLFCFQLKGAMKMATGKWLLKADAVIAFGLDEKAFNTQLRLGNPRISREYGRKLHIGASFNEHVGIYCMIHP
jgi:hypothetical protein